MPFSGIIKVKLVEAIDLKPTDLTSRHPVALAVGKSPSLIDPYVTINIDDELVCKSTTKQRTLKPVWNEVRLSGLVVVGMSQIYLLSH